MKGGVFLDHVDGGESANSLVGTIEGSDELLLIVMRDVQLQAEAHAVAFQCACHTPSALAMASEGFFARAPAAWR